MLVKQHGIQRIYFGFANLYPTRFHINNSQLVSWKQLFKAFAAILNLSNLEAVPCLQISAAIGILINSLSGESYNLRESVAQFACSQYLIPFVATIPGTLKRRLCRL